MNGKQLGEGTKDMAPSLTLMQLMNLYGYMSWKHTLPVCSLSNAIEVRAYPLCKIVESYSRQAYPSTKKTIRTGYMLVHPAGVWSNALGWALMMSNMSVATQFDDA